MARGVKQCILSGGVSLPVPGVLAALHSSASNSVLVQQGSVAGHRLFVEDSEHREPVDKT